jgi:hypothetical protein
MAPFAALRRSSLPPGSGAAVMAIGIFGIAALPELASGAAALRRPLSLAVLALWAILALAFIAEWLDGRDPRHGPPMRRAALGTWAAGTAVTAKLLQLGMPQWTPLALALGIAALGLWLWYLPIAAGIASALLAQPAERTTGAILLATVSTQSIALLLTTLPSPPARAAALGLTALGAAFYGGGAALMLRSFLAVRRWRLTEDWDNANCILHGAASITGLACVLSGDVPGALCLALWAYTAVVFVLVEAVELTRLVERVHAYGGMSGALTYYASQWARNFTFGMFYAFTRAYLLRFGAASDPSWLAAIQRAVFAGGQYVVLALLVAEIGVALAGRSD